MSHMTPIDLAEDNHAADGVQADALAVCALRRSGHRPLNNTNSLTLRSAP